MLPGRARRARKQISRARLDHERRAVPRLPRLAAKAQCAGRQQRHADDFVELRLVPMPADSRAGPIFVDENLAEGFLRAIENRGDLAPQGNEKRRKRGSLNDRATIIVVAVAEAHHLAVGQKSLKVERLERKLAKFARECFLFLDRQNFRIIAEPFRQARGRGKQIGLTGGRGGPDAAGWSLHPPIDKRRRGLSKAPPAGSCLRLYSPRRAAAAHSSAAFPSARANWRMRTGEA